MKTWFWCLITFEWTNNNIFRIGLISAFVIIISCSWIRLILVIHSWSEYSFIKIFICICCKWLLIFIFSIDVFHNYCLILLLLLLIILRFCIGYWVIIRIPITTQQHFLLKFMLSLWYLQHCALWIAIFIFRIVFCIERNFKVYATFSHLLILVMQYSAFASI